MSNILEKYLKCTFLNILTGRTFFIYIRNVNIHLTCPNLIDGKFIFLGLVVLRTLHCIVSKDKQ